MTFYSDEAIKNATKLIQEIETQTDRGVAIVGAAWVEEELQAAIEGFLEDDKHARERLFRKSGPLSSFSAKIDLGRLLGMMSSAVSSDLHMLREIRNEFAHSVLDRNNSILSFTTSHIKDKCLAIRCVEHENHQSPRAAFIRACAILNADFYLHNIIANKVKSNIQIMTYAEKNHGS